MASEMSRRVIAAGACAPFGQMYKSKGGEHVVYFLVETCAINILSKQEHCHGGCPGDLPCRCH